MKSIIKKAFPFLMALSLLVSFLTINTFALNFNWYGLKDSNFNNKENYDAGKGSFAPQLQKRADGVGDWIWIWAYDYGPNTEEGKEAIPPVIPAGQTAGAEVIVLTQYSKFTVKGGTLQMSWMIRVHEGAEAVLDGGKIEFIPTNGTETQKGGVGPIQLCGMGEYALFKVKKGTLKTDYEIVVGMAHPNGSGQLTKGKLEVSGGIVDCGDLAVCRDGADGIVELSNSGIIKISKYSVEGTDIGAAKVKALNKHIADRKIVALTGSKQVKLEETADSIILSVKPGGSSNTEESSKPSTVSKADGTASAKPVATESKAGDTDNDTSEPLPETNDKESLIETIKTKLQQDESLKADDYDKAVWDQYIASKDALKEALENEDVLYAELNALFEDYEQNLVLLTDFASPEDSSDSDSSSSIEAGGKTTNKWLFFAAAVVVILLIAGVAAYFFVFRKPNDSAAK